MINRPSIKGDNLVTTNVTKPNTPDFIIRNDRQKDIKIYYITLLPNAFFKTNGKVLIEIDGLPTIIDFPFGTLKRTSELVLQMTPEGATFPRNSVIKIFIWLNSAGTGELTTLITIGE